MIAALVFYAIMEPYTSRPGWEDPENNGAAMGVTAVAMFTSGLLVVAGIMLIKAREPGPHEEELKSLRKPITRNEWLIALALTVALAVLLALFDLPAVWLPALLLWWLVRRRVRRN